LPLFSGRGMQMAKKIEKPIESAEQAAMNAAIRENLTNETDTKTTASKKKATRRVAKPKLSEAKAGEKDGEKDGEITEAQPVGQPAKKVAAKPKRTPRAKATNSKKDLAEPKNDEAKQNSSVARVEIAGASKPSPIANETKQQVAIEKTEVVVEKVIPAPKPFQVKSETYTIAPSAKQIAEDKAKHEAKIQAENAPIPVKKVEQTVAVKPNIRVETIPPKAVHNISKVEAEVTVPAESNSGADAKQANEQHNRNNRNDRSKNRRNNKSGNQNRSQQSLVAEDTSGADKVSLPEDVKNTAETNVTIDDKKSEVASGNALAEQKSHQTRNQQNANRPQAGNKPNQPNNRNQERSKEPQKPQDKEAVKETNTPKAVAPQQNINPNKNQDRARDNQKQPRPAAEPRKENLAPAPKPEQSKFRYTNINRERLLTENQRKDKAIGGFVAKVEDFLRNKLFVEREIKVLLAVSGGVDSIAMLDVMANLTSSVRLDLTVVHFNHKFRGEESDSDEKFVQKLAESYNIPFMSASSNVAEYAEANSLSFEAAGRLLRYKYFEKIVSSGKYHFVATAHTADDSAETLLINLLRGTGLTGLSGIPGKRHFNKNVSLIRPLIECTKNELLVYSKLRNLKWREDSTNLDLQYTRNKIRHDLLPKLRKEYNPNIVEVLNRAARSVAGADKFVQQAVKEYLEAVVITGDSQDGRFAIKINLLDTHNSFIQGEILQSALQRYAKVQPISLNSIDRILDLKRKESGSICELECGYNVVKDRENLIFYIKEEAPKFSHIFRRPGKYRFGRYELKLEIVDGKNIKFGQNRNIEYLDADFLPQMLMLRNWEQGDYFKPLGMEGVQKVADFLNNQKLPVIDKPFVPVLTDKVNILWVCGYRIAEDYKVRRDSAEVLKIEFIDHKAKSL